MDDEWDRQIERDVAAGRLDALLREAVNEVEAGYPDALGRTTYRGKPNTKIRILNTLAEYHPIGLSIREIADATKTSLHTVQDAMKYLREHDLVTWAHSEDRPATGGRGPYLYWRADRLGGKSWV